MLLKKISALAVLATTLLCMPVGATNNKEIVPADPIDWSLSVSDSSKSTKYHPNWTIAEENKFGIFAYDLNSMGFLTQKKEKNKNIVECKVKAVFTNKDMIKQLNEKYASKLQPKEKAAQWIMNMQFNLSEKSYIIRKTECFGSKNTLLDKVERKGDMTLIPEESFAERMYNICKEWAEDNQDTL